ncbi:hypothetical protein F5Y18DRAFT_438283 [Xylariaceae sp. FL1019]|nr:hypothetical protein F5Y18DRAFT_438283 [Xylariaceae sp. FL1019]
MASPETKMASPDEKPTTLLRTDEIIMDDGSIRYLEVTSKGSFFNDQKVCCLECKKGHRSSTCPHAGTKPLVFVANPGRPPKSSVPVPKEPEVAIHAYLYYYEDGVTLKPGVDPVMAAKGRRPEQSAQALSQQDAAHTAGPSANPSAHPNAQMVPGVAPRASLHYNLPNPGYMAEPRDYIGDGLSNPYSHQVAEGLADFSDPTLADLFTDVMLPGTRPLVMDGVRRNQPCQCAPCSMAAMNEHQEGFPIMGGAHGNGSCQCAPCGMQISHLSREVQAAMNEPQEDFPVMGGSSEGSQRPISRTERMPAPIVTASMPYQQFVPPEYRFPNGAYGNNGNAGLGNPGPNYAIPHGGSNFPVQAPPRPASMDGVNPASPDLNQQFVGGFNMVNGVSSQTQSPNQDLMDFTDEQKHAPIHPGLVGGLELPAQAVDQGYVNGVDELAQVPDYVFMDVINQAANQELMDYPNQVPVFDDMYALDGDWSNTDAEQNVNAPSPSHLNEMGNTYYPVMPFENSMELNNVDYQEDHDMEDSGSTGQEYVPELRINPYGASDAE